MSKGPDPIPMEEWSLSSLQMKLRQECAMQQVRVTISEKNKEVTFGITDPDWNDIPESANVLKEKHGYQLFRQTELPFNE